MTRSKALVLTTNPGGTAMPARCNSPRLPPLPPTRGLSSRPMSANQLIICAGGIDYLAKYRHNPAAAVDPDPLAVLDARSCIAGSNHRGQAKLARNDRGMAHRAANVRYRCRYLLEDGSPGWIGDLTHEDVSLPQAADLLDRLDHPGRSFDDTAGGAARPRSSLLSPPPSAESQASRFSRVIPQSMTIAGSSITAGTGPSAGGVACLPHSTTAARRAATIVGQCAGPRGSEPLDQEVIRSTIASSSS